MDSSGAGLAPRRGLANRATPNRSLGLLKTISARLNATLLVAAGSACLTIGGATADPATYDGPCALDGTTVTCTGDEAAGGVNVGDVGVTELDVNTINGNIAPADGTAGVVLDTSNAATADIQLGSYSIQTSGVGADGLYISAWGDDTNANLTLSGDVQSLGGQGVVVTGSGAVTSNTTGDIASDGDALTAKSWGDAVEVDHTGDLTSWEGRGLYVEGLGSDIDIEGNVDSLGDGVYSHSWGAGLTNLVINGNVTAREGSGVVVEEDNDSAEVDVTGDVTAHVDGISVEAQTDVTIDDNGTLITDTGTGIYAKSSLGGVNITQEGGPLTAHGDGIVADAHGEGGITINATQDITSDDGRGVVATAAGGDVTLDLTDVTAKQASIWTEASDGKVDIDVTGNVVSYDGNALYAKSDDNTVDVTVGGSVTSKLDGVHVESSDTATVNTGDIVSYDGAGVYATSSNGAVNLTLGGVTSKLDAIYADADSESVTVGANDVVSYAGKGVYAKSSAGSAGVTVGDVTSQLDAITALSDSSDVTVNADDVVSYAGKGIYATTPNGLVNLTLGSVTSQDDAIYAQSTGASSDGSITVTATGDVQSYGGSGIYAGAANGPVEIDVGGLVGSHDDAITAHADDGSVTVNVVGDVNSDTGKGIAADSLNGAVDVEVGSDDPVAISGVTSKGDAITAETKSGAATVGVTGDVVSYDGKGIYATSATGPVTIAVGGDVTSQQDSILAQSSSGAATDLVTVDVGGNVTSYDGKAVQATAANGGVSVNVDGGVTSQDDAVTASTTGAGAASTVTVTTNGVTSYAGRGIDAEAADRAVTVDNTGALTAELTGIYARSTGGDGTAAVGITQSGYLTSWQGAGIDALSTGGPVSVTTSGGIEAELDAIDAASQGGDNVGTVTVTNTGGNIVSYTGSGIVASSAREGVTVTNTGDIDANQDGISATSTGDTGTSGVTIGQTGDITVANGSGIHVESLADAGITLDGDITGGAYGINATSLAGAVDVGVVADSVISGAGQAGAYLNSYTTAKLTNRGDLSSASGTAFEFDGDGAGTVDNYGTISGSFAFDEGTGTFNNQANATYNAGTEMDFLGGGTFNNSGLLSMTTDLPDSALENTYLTGDFAQTDTGTLRTDIRFSDNWSDRLVVSGTADLAGAVSVNVNGDLYGGIDKDFKILTADDGLTLGDVSLTNPTLHGSIIEENGTDAILRIDDIDFGPDGIDPTYDSLGDYLENIFKVGVPDGLQPLMASLLSIPDLEDYDQALAQITPEEYAQDLVSTSAANLDFTNRLLSCRVADGPNRFKAEGNCNWVDGRLTGVQQDTTGGMSGYDETFETLEAGAQRRLDGDWRVGAGVGFSNSTTSAADGSTAHAIEGQAGVIVKYDADAWLLASALTGGYGVHHTERNVIIGAVDDTLVGDSPIGYASTRLNAAYTFDMGSTYIKPLFNLDLTLTRFGGVTETGGSTALTIDPATLYTASFNPAIEIGGEFADDGGNLIRPFLQVGLQAAVTSDLALAARFSDVDPSLGSFTIAQPASEPAVKVSLGADVLTKDRQTIRLYYDGTYSASSRKNGLGLKLSNNF